MPGLSHRNLLPVLLPVAHPRSLRSLSSLSIYSQIADGVEASSAFVAGAGLGSIAAALGFLTKKTGPVSEAASTGLAPVTEAEVLEVQSKWAGAIKNISKIYKEGGDFVRCCCRRGRRRALRSLSLPP